MNTAHSETRVAEVQRAIRTVLDPEFGIPVDDLGLIYNLEVRGAEVQIKMTLTTEHCPAGEVIVNGVQAAVASVPGVEHVSVDLVWDPVWTPVMLNAKAREQLGWG